MCVWSKDMTGLRAGCWYEQFPTTVVRSLIQFLPSQPLSTPLWLIRNVSGVILSAGWGRGWKYLQSSWEGISLGVDWWVATALLMPAQNGRTLKLVKWHHNNSTHRKEDNKTYLLNPGTFISNKTHEMIWVKLRIWCIMYEKLHRSMKSWT